MEKSEFKELKERLLSTKKNGYDILPEADRAAMEDYCAAYGFFRNRSDEFIEALIRRGE